MNLTYPGTSEKSPEGIRIRGDIRQGKKNLNIIRSVASHPRVGSDALGSSAWGKNQRKRMQRRKEKRVERNGKERGSFQKVTW